MIEVYKGKEITRDKIKIIKSIAKRRYPINIYHEYFQSITTLKGLCRLHLTELELETLVIGTDWFLCFSELDDDVEITEWVALDNHKKITQVIEMMQVLKELMLNNRDKLFIADMRHDTSYRFFSNMVDKGLAYPIRNNCILDCATPLEFRKVIENFNSIEAFLESDISLEYKDYLKYILHSISFIVTNQFVKRYYVSVNNQDSILTKH